MNRLSATSPLNYQRRRTGYGMWQQPYMPVGPVEAHMQKLNQAGIGRRLVARMSGISRTTVERIGRNKGSLPKLTRIRPETAAAILAVNPNRSGTLSAPANVRVPALGTQRRLQALMAIGWTAVELAERLGWDNRNLGKVCQQTRVTAGTARAIADLYGELSATFPHGAKASRARKVAARKGWKPPSAYPDGALDDPQAGIADALTADADTAGLKLRIVWPVVDPAMYDTEATTAAFFELPDFLERFGVDLADRPVMRVRDCTPEQVERIGAVRAVVCEVAVTRRSNTQLSPAASCGNSTEGNPA